MAVITYDEITSISSVKASSDNQRLRIVDFWVEPTAGIGGGDTINNAALGVSAVRAVLAMTFLDGGDWLGADPTTDYVVTRMEHRARAAHSATSSSVTAPAVASDADYLGFILGDTYDAMWIQLLVEA